VATRRFRGRDRSSPEAERRRHDERDEPDRKRCEAEATVKPEELGNGLRAPSPGTETELGRHR
jgi:hypothetical protein